jgi:hypothetical protein
MPVHAAKGPASSQYFVVDLTLQNCTIGVTTGRIAVKPLRPRRCAIGCPRETFLMDVEEVTPRRMQSLSTDHRRLAPSAPLHQYACIAASCPSRHAG